eukprot:6604493-Pyramimonas_sp.AAC.3
MPRKGPIAYEPMTQPCQACDRIGGALGGLVLLVLDGGALQLRRELVCLLAGLLLALLLLLLFLLRAVSGVVVVVVVFATRRELLLGILIRSLEGGRLCMHARAHARQGGGQTTLFASRGEQREKSESEQLVARSKKTRG